MPLEPKPQCVECGAQLRAGKTGQRCDLCQRMELLPLLPPDFYDQPPLEAALQTLDFGPVFLAIRARSHWSQQTLGEYLDLGRARISDIEHGKRSLHDLGTVVRVANKLNIPAGKLGFRYGLL